MIKLEKTEVMGLEAAIRGMRNPKNSWEKSDSRYCSEYGHPPIEGSCEYCPHDKMCDKSEKSMQQMYLIEDNDLNLMTTLRNAGTDHRKFMRMIVVYLDITAPLYWWKEFDTYKVGTVANSCSTMHKIQEKEFTLENFSCENLYDDEYELLKETIKVLNADRKLYLKSKKKNDWWQMIQLLPSSYNQTRNVMMNYEVLCNIYHSRKGHRLDEWIVFRKWIESLPYSEIITKKEELK